MMPLTEELRQAIREHPDKPVRLTDPTTQQSFVLLRAELYDRLKALLYEDSELVLEEAYLLLDEAAARAGWDDPAMDIYNDFAPKDRP
jgi:hypothetical protein